MSITIPITSQGGGQGKIVLPNPTVIPGGPPTVISVSPPSGVAAGGTSVTVSGTNFLGATAVTFGGVSATSIIVVNASTITCVTPVGSGAVNVAVTTPQGTGTGVGVYTYTSFPAGVTLQAIDGESMIGGGAEPRSMTHNYFSSNGYTFATPSNPSYPTVNWDSPSYFPLGCYYGLYALTPGAPPTGDISTFLDLGLSFSNGISGGSDFAGVISNGIQGLTHLAFASFTASITGTVMTVTAMASPPLIQVNATIVGAGVTANTVITSLGTGTGGTGTYNVSISQTVGSESMQSTGGSEDAPAAGPIMADWMIGLHLDEPAALSDVQDPMSNVIAANQSGRLWDVVLTKNNLIVGKIGSPGDTLANTLSLNYWNGPVGGPAHLSIARVGGDFYWFATQNDTAFGQVYGASIMQWTFTPTGQLTRAQMARGSNYGSMQDVWRSFGNGTNSGGGFTTPGTSGAPSRIPLVAVIESYEGLWTSLPQPILPHEIHWAVWSSIIHGARAIDYFSGVGSTPGRLGFDNTVYGGQTTSVYAQTKVTAALVNSVATVLNSPFALNCLTAISPHGYLFPVPESNWLNGGCEACVKWDGTHFYIFATMREADTMIPTSVTFTLNSNITSSQVTVIGESRTLPISGHQFTDTFANAWTLHIYRID